MSPQIGRLSSLKRLCVLNGSAKTSKAELKRPIHTDGTRGLSCHMPHCIHYLVSIYCNNSTDKLTPSDSAQQVRRGSLDASRWRTKTKQVRGSTKSSTKYDLMSLQTQQTLVREQAYTRCGYTDPCQVLTPRLFIHMQTVGRAVDGILFDYTKIYNFRSILRVFDSLVGPCLPACNFKITV